MNQSSLEVLGKQIRFFMCRGAGLKDLFERYIENSMPCRALVLSLLWFSRDMREVLTLWS